MILTISYHDNTNITIFLWGAATIQMELTDAASEINLESFPFWNNTKNNKPLSKIIHELQYRSKIRLSIIKNNSKPFFFSIKRWPPSCATSRCLSAFRNSLFIPRSPVKNKKKCKHQRKSRLKFLLDISWYIKDGKNL